MEHKVKLEKSATPQQSKSNRYKQEDDEEEEDEQEAMRVVKANTGPGAPRNPPGASIPTKNGNKQQDYMDDDAEEDDLGFGGIEDGEGGPCSPEDAEFDQYVSAIQDVLVSDEFNEAVENFHRTHCSKFVETEENTHEMWTLHKRFKAEIELLLENLIKQQVPQYTQSRFEKLCGEREGQIDEAVLDALLAFDNFQEFKRQGLETRLRQMKREEPERYKQVIQTQQNYTMVQEIHSLLLMEEEGIAVCGGLGADDMF